MDSQQGLPVLQAGGFSASVDAHAWDRDPARDAFRMRLWFLSLLGSQQAVHALWARFVVELDDIPLVQPEGAVIE